MDMTISCAHFVCLRLTMSDRRRSHSFTFSTSSPEAIILRCRIEYMRRRVGIERRGPERAICVIWCTSKDAIVPQSSCVPFMTWQRYWNVGYWYFVFSLDSNFLHIMPLVSPSMSDNIFTWPNRNIIIRRIYNIIIRRIYSQCRWCYQCSTVSWSRECWLQGRSW